MNYEKSCGYVVYRMMDGIRKYLIIESLSGKIGLPKGHVEKDETEYDTANRELLEETNVTAEPVEGFRKSIEYKLVNKKDTWKEVVFFIGRYSGGEIHCQECEIAKCSFMTYEEAYPILTLDSVREVLKEAHTFLEQAV